MAIYEYLEEFREISFHMPGHKGRIPVSIRDVTELSGTDNLMCPTSIILEAQENMAKKLGKKHAFFLTNGATSGVLASILSVTKADETVLVDRNCHVSVINGLILSGAVPKFIYPAENERFGIPNPLLKDDISVSKEKVLILTSPTYYGEVCDMKSIRNKVGNMTIIQDESHGAHFYFCEALKQYRDDSSDLSVLSFHKTMPTLNQGAVLALNSDTVSAERVKHSINLVNTTSPSYPILSSLDYSGSMGEVLYQNTDVLNEILLWKQELEETTPFCVLDNQDCYKLFLNCDACSLTALEIQRYLEKQYHIYIEGVFGNNLLFMFSPCNTLEEIRLLKHAISSLKIQEKELLPKKKISILRLNQKLSPREAYFADGEVLPVKQAIGRVSKENITEFPPCVPVVTVGEELNEEAVSMIQKEYITVVK